MSDKADPNQRNIISSGNRGLLTTRPTNLIRRGLEMLSTGQAKKDVAWETFMQAGREAFQAGLDAEAEKQFENAIKEAEKLGSPNILLATSLQELAGLYHSQRRLALALSFYQQALNIKESLLGQENSEVMNLRLDLVPFYCALNKYDEAEALARQVLAIDIRVLGLEHPHVALSLESLAEICKVEGKHAESESFYRQSLSIMEKTLGPEHAQVVMCLESYATLLHLTNRNSEAEKIILRAKTIREKYANEKRVAYFNNEYRNNITK